MLLAATAMSLASELTMEPVIELATRWPPFFPMSVFTTAAPTAIAAVAPPPVVRLLLRPAAIATVPATPTTSMLSRASTLTAPGLLTVLVAAIELVTELSSWFTAAEPAPATAAVQPVPPALSSLLATDTETPIPRAETYAFSSAASATPSLALTIAPEMSVATESLILLWAMPTPIDRAPALPPGLSAAA